MFRGPRSKANLESKSRFFTFNKNLRSNKNIRLQTDLCLWTFSALKTNRSLSTSGPGTSWRRCHCGETAQQLHVYGYYTTSSITLFHFNMAKMLYNIHIHATVAPFPRNDIASRMRGNGATVACIWILYNIFAMLKWNNVIFPRYVDT
jgi:hypothetical protein